MISDVLMVLTRKYLIIHTVYKYRVTIRKSQRNFSYLFLFIPTFPPQFHTILLPFRPTSILG
jgi:hypothetical protein